MFFLLIKLENRIVFISFKFPIAQLLNLVASYCSFEIVENLHLNHITISIAWCKSTERKKTIHERILLWKKLVSETMRTIVRLKRELCLGILQFIWCSYELAYQIKHSIFIDLCRWMMHWNIEHFKRVSKAVVGINKP